LYSIFARIATIVKSCEINNICDNIQHECSSMTYEDQNIKNNVGSYGSSKSLNKYFCCICDYITDKKSNHDKHLSSVKHMKKVAYNKRIFKCDSCEYTKTVHFKLKIFYFT